MSQKRSITNPRNPDSIFEWGSATDVGMLRTMNQDFYATSSSLFLVADGMGGHLGGEFASEIATTKVFEEQEYPNLEAFREQIRNANTEVRSEAEKNLDRQGMGTTLCGITALRPTGEAPAQLAIANIGDSRIYLLSAGSFSQITTDHSLVEEMRREGKITDQQAENHPHRNIITRALGIDIEAEVDCWQLHAQRNDRFLLCTDGLSNEVSDPEICDILQNHDDPQEAAQQLIELANRHGGNDNITAVVVDVKEGRDAPVPSKVSTTPIAMESANEHRSQTPTAEDSALTASEIIEWEATPQNIKKLIITALVMLLIVGLFVGRYARDNYFISFEQIDGTSVENSQILIFQGRTNSILWFDATIEDRRPILGRDLDEATVEEIQQKPQFETLQEANQYLDDLQDEISENRQKTD